MKRLWRQCLGMLPALAILGCGGASSGDASAADSAMTRTAPAAARPANVPEFLYTAFIELGQLGNTAQTFDFTQQAYAGVQTVEIRNWQKIGSLGWQSYQLYSAAYDTNGQQVRIVSPTGFSDLWTIVAVSQGFIDIVDQQGIQRRLFNCLTPGWPPLIFASTRACNR